MKAALCVVSEIPADGTKKVDFFGREVLVYRQDGVPKAAMNVCMHLGGPLEQVGEKFVCGWHGAEFSCADGHRLKGPARAESRLMFLPTRIEDGTLFYVWQEPA
jgi:nitrite reductase/ring-hydroxylating ferredoxin subunit